MEPATSLYRAILQTATHTTWSANERVLALSALMERLMVEATKQEQIAFSTLFARICYVGYKYQFQAETLQAIHAFRRLSARVRSGQPAYEKDVKLGVKALAETVLVVYTMALPAELIPLLPASDEWQYQPPDIWDFKALARVIALRDEPDAHCLVAIDEEDPTREIRVVYDIPDRNETFRPSIRLLRQVFQFPIDLHLIDVDIDREGRYRPRAFVIEPDYLLDVSAIAECFKDTGPEPLSFLVRKFLPHETTLPIFMGNVANYFLDRLLNEPKVPFAELFKETFRIWPFTYAPMEDKTVRELSQMAQKHYVTLFNMANGGLAKEGIHPEHCVLEPSFFSQQYGIQGRLDLFYRTSERAVIVELKSGKPFKPNKYGITRSHFTQTLLYDLLVRSVYGRQLDPAKYILYSVQPDRPLCFAPTIEAEQFEAINLRNQLIAIEWLLCQIQPGQETIPLLNRLTSAAGIGKGFLERDIKQFEALYAPLTTVEKKYFNAFAGFIAREQWLAKVGVHDVDHLNGHATLWRSSFEEKQAAFGIISHLQITENCADQSAAYIVFEKTTATNPLANFRVGDIAVLYPAEADTDTVLDHQVIKCTITELTATQVRVQLRYRQFNLAPFETEGLWCLEPDLMEIGFGAMYPALAIPQPLQNGNAGAGDTPGSKRRNFNEPDADLIIDEDEDDAGELDIEQPYGVPDDQDESYTTVEEEERLVYRYKKLSPQERRRMVLDGSLPDRVLRSWVGAYNAFYQTTTAERWAYLSKYIVENRRKSTEAADILWNSLRGGKFYGIHFRREHAVEKYIADFAALEYRLIIEVDGPIHDKRQEYDALRTEYLNACGFEVIRFTNDEIRYATLKALVTLKQAIDARRITLEQEKHPSIPPGNHSPQKETPNQSSLPPVAPQSDNPPGHLSPLEEDRDQVPLPRGGARGGQSRLLQSIITSPQYFLLWGPPGTGKTSVMLRDLSKWVLENTSDNLLLLAYTNRAVDEICEALDDIGGDIRQQYLRIGSQYATAERFREQLLTRKIADADNRAELRTVLENHRIFVSTVASFSQNSNLLQLKRFQRLVVDEASQLLEPQIIGLLLQFDHYVLIGDHKQLPAVTAQTPEQTRVTDPDLNAIGLTDLRMSYFERMYRLAEQHDRYDNFGRLSEQGRMDETIMAFPNEQFYGGFLSTMLPEQKDDGAIRVQFMSVIADETGHNRKTNRAEADMAAQLVLQFKQAWEKAGREWEPLKSLGIITPWRAQIAQLRESLAAVGVDPNDVTVDTVERYQGGAREVIIISTCVNSPYQLPALVSLSDEGVDRKLNVALTRARKHLIMLGNEVVLREDDRYRDFIERYGKN